MMSVAVRGRMTRRQALVFSFLLVAAFVIRLFFIKNYPLNIDEAQVLKGMVVLDTGSVPVQFQGFGGGEYVLLPFLARLLRSIFSLDSLVSIRLVVLASNISFLISLFYLARRICNDRAAWIALTFGVVWPWSILAGSIGFGAHLMLALGCGSMLLLLKYSETGMARYSYWSFVLLAMTFYAYPASLFWAPVVLLTFFLTYKRMLITRDTIAGFALMLMLIMPIIIFYLKNQFGLVMPDHILFFEIPKLQYSRFNEVAFLGEASIGVMSVKYAANYLTHFFFPVLHSGVFTGRIQLSFLAFMWDSLFIYTAFFTIIRKWRSHTFVISWLFLYPLGSSFTIIPEGISFTRDIMALPLLLMLSAYGATLWYQFIERAWKNRTVQKTSRSTHA